MQHLPEMRQAVTEIKSDVLNMSEDHIGWGRFWVLSLAGLGFTQKIFLEA